MGQAARFGQEAVFVRSWPPRRIGKPLQYGETRFLDVLTVRAPSTAYEGQRTATLTKAVLRCHPARSAANDRMQTVPEINHERRDCATAHGVPLFGLHLFELRHTVRNGEADTMVGQGGHALLPAYYTSQMAPPHHWMRGKLRKAAAQALGTDTPLPLAGEYALAAALMRIPVRDMGYGLAHPLMVEAKPLEDFCENQMCRDKCIEAIDNTRPYAERAAVVAYNVLVADYMADLAGPAAIVDMMAHSFHDGSLFDELRRPCGLPLLLVLAARIAAYPRRFPIGRSEQHYNAKLPHDALAAARLARAMEAVLRAPSRSSTRRTGRPCGQSTRSATP